jgi:hypothetical protein
LFAAFWQSQIDDGVSGVDGNIDGQRIRIAGAVVEGRAVGEYASSIVHRHFADAQCRLIDFQMEEAPEQASRGFAARLDEPLQVAILLLKMLRPQEHPFRPDDFAVPGHDGLLTMRS